MTTEPNSSERGHTIPPEIVEAVIRAARQCEAARLAGGNVVYLDRCDITARHNVDAVVVALAARVAELERALRDLMWRFDDDDSDPHSPKETAPDILQARSALAQSKKSEK